MIHNRVNKEILELTSEPLEQLLNIHETFTKNKSLHFVVKDSITLGTRSLYMMGTRSLIIDVCYNNSPIFVDFPFLPDELNRKIHSYRGDYIHIKLIMLIPKSYPFSSSPVFIIKEVKHNIKNKKDITVYEYYKRQISSYNILMKKNFICAMKMKHIILQLIVAINDFEIWL